RGAGRVRGAAIVARQHDARPMIHLDQDLRRAKDMARRMEADRHPANLDAPHGHLLLRGELGTIADGHNLKSLPRRQYRAMTGARMVGMAMGDQGPLDRPQRIKVKIPRRAVEPRLGWP